MKATNRLGYHYESAHTIKQWLDVDDLDADNMSYFPLKDSIVVQLFKHGKYFCCIVTQFNFGARDFRIKDNDTITSIPLSTFKQKNNGKLYDEAIA
jgi:hypothetical protein